MNVVTPRISDVTIEEVKERADIYDVISRHVALRKSGKEFVGLCPFHKESTPSFSVSPAKRMYYCFGCQSGGDVIKFAMDFHTSSFSEAVTGLAEQYGVTVVSSSPEHDRKAIAKKLHSDSLYEIVASAANFYRNSLHQPMGRNALNYLIQERGLTTESIEELQLGYAPPSGTALYKYLTEDRSYPAEIVQASGLISSRCEYDLFRDRIMIPIRESMGRVIAFGGRSLGKVQPKYLNSSDSEIFSKGNNLFGINVAKESIAQNNSVIVVEGYFDVIALHSSGIRNAVAPMGTALSMNQIRLATKYMSSGSMILNFDSDSAGENATDRCIAESLSTPNFGVHLKVLRLKNCKDAAEFISAHTPEEYISLVEKSPHCIQWQIDNSCANSDLSNALNFSQVFRRLVNIVKGITDDSLRAFYIPICAGILSNGNSSIRGMLIKNITSECRGKSKSTIVPSISQNKKPQHEINELSLLRIYIHVPKHRELIWRTIRDRRIQFTISSHRTVWQMLISDHYSAIENTSSQELDHISERLHRYESDGEYDISVIPDLLFNGPDDNLMPHGDTSVQYLINQMDISLARKRCKYLLDMWRDVDPLNNQKKSEVCYRLFLEEKSRVSEIISHQSVMFANMLYGNYG